MGGRESFHAHGFGDSDARSHRTATLSFAFFSLNTSTVLADTLDCGPALFCLIFCISSTISLVASVCFVVLWDQGRITNTLHIVNIVNLSRQFPLIFMVAPCFVDLSLADGRSNRSQELIYSVRLHHEISPLGSAVSHSHTIIGARYGAGAKVFHIGNWFPGGVGHVGKLRRASLMTRIINGTGCGDWSRDVWNRDLCLRPRDGRAPTLPPPKKKKVKRKRKI